MILLTPQGGSRNAYNFPEENDYLWLETVYINIIKIVRLSKTVSADPLTIEKPNSNIFEPNPPHLQTFELTHVNTISYSAAKHLLT